MAKESKVEGLKISSSKNRLIDCEVCNLAKMIRKKKPRKRTRSQVKEDEVVAVDTVGPINWSRKGHRYVLFISNRGWVTPYFLKKKSDAYGKVKEYFAEVDRQHGIDFIRTFRGDNEFNITSLQNFFKEHGIKTEFTVPHNPFQNGRAERFHRSVWIWRVRCSSRQNCQTLSGNTQSGMLYISEID